MTTTTNGILKAWLAVPENYEQLPVRQVSKELLSFIKVSVPSIRVDFDNYAYLIGEHWYRVTTS